MFSHPLSNGQENNQSGKPSPEEWIRHYQVPAIRDKKDALNMVLNKIQEANYQPHIHYNYPIVRLIAWTVAASVLIAFLLFFEKNQSTFQFSEVQNAFFLPDQSRLILGENSVAQYSETLWGRKIRLRGDGYFEVVKGRPFTVVTPIGKVKVLGTRFSVFEKNNELSVECYEGKVAYHLSFNNRNIEAGEKLNVKHSKIGETKELTRKYPDIAYYSKFYEKADMEEVFDDMERFFGLSIEFEGIDKPMHFTGKVSNPHIDTLLSIICIPFNLEYTFIDHQKIIIKPVI
jgi:transmembrane sensor